MTPDDVIEEVKSSGLRGRGGAGFPTGTKWSFIPQNTGKPVYVVVNADESEPGTFNNRELMERDPHQFLEGLIICSYAVNCRTAFVYCRGEFVWPGTVLERAVAEAYERGYLGAKVAGSDYALDVVVHRGADGHPRAGPDRDGRRRHGRQGAEGVHARRLLDALSHSPTPGHAHGFRLGRRGGLAPGDEGRDRARRTRLRGRRRAPVHAVL